MALTPQQIDDYYKTQSGLANPLSPAQYEANLTQATPTVPTTLSSASLSSTPTPQFQTAQQVPNPAPPVIPESAYAATPKETEISGLIKDLTASSGLESERLAFQAEQEKAVGLEELQRTEQDYTAQLKQLEADFKNIEPQSQINAEGRGVTAGGLAPITASEQRRVLIKANTVSALLSAAQGRVAFAQQQIDRTVNLKFAQREADRRAKIENLQLLQQDPTLSLEQQKRADARMLALKREAETDARRKEDTQTIMKWAVELANNPLVAKQIADIATSDNPDLQKAFALYSANQPKSVPQVLGSASSGYFTFDPTTGQTMPIGVLRSSSAPFASTAAYQPGQLTQLLQSQGKTADDATLKALWSEYGTGGTYTNDVAHNSVIYNAMTGGSSASSDPFVQQMLASDGGKPITDTFAQKIDKGLVVLNQIGALQNNIEGTDTGPLLGLFRGANPWDTNAQTIKAQLNAIVPNLARGVYGEVGVLTDNDIKNYAKTLPTLTSTEDIRNAVLGITVDMIGRSIKNTLAVNLANGKDVSGFVDLYQEMLDTRDSIFAQIKGDIPAEETVDATTSFWGGISNFLFGDE